MTGISSVFGEMTQDRQPQIAETRRGWRLYKNSRKDPLGYFTSMMLEEGDNAWMNIGGNDVFLVSNPDIVQRVLQTNQANYHKSKFYELLRPILGRGIFSAEGAAWQQQRKTLAPAFMHKNYAAYTAHIVSAVDEMLGRWGALPRGARIDLNAEMMRLTLDISMRSMFAWTDEQSTEAISHALGTLLREAEFRIWSPLALPQAWVLKRRKYQDALRTLDEAAASVIEKRRRQVVGQGDLLDMIMEDCRETGDDKLLRDQVLSIILASHDTTANAMTWACHFIARYPEIEEKLQAEAQSVLGDGEPAFEDIGKLDYTSRVFMEALRLYPPVWTMSRQAIADDVISTDGREIRIPAGSIMMVCAYAVHRNPKYWPDPEAFNPERFTSAETEKRHRFAFLPFSAGQRSCMGARFANVEAVLALSLIMRRFHLHLVPGQGVVPEPMITLRPNKPVFFTLEKREARTGFRSDAHPAAASPACPFHKTA